MYLLLIAKQKCIKNLNLKVKVTKSLFLKWTKTGIPSLFTPILASIAENDRKINNTVIDNYVFSVDC